VAQILIGLRALLASNLKNPHPALQGAGFFMVVV
jgi:hypothetical protein